MYFFLLFNVVPRGTSLQVFVVSMDDLVSLKYFKQDKFGNSSYILDLSNSCTSKLIIPDNAIQDMILHIENELNKLVHYKGTVKLEARVGKLVYYGDELPREGVEMSVAKFSDDKSRFRTRFEAALSESSAQQIQILAEDGKNLKTFDIVFSEGNKVRKMSLVIENDSLKINRIQEDRTRKFTVDLILPKSHDLRISLETAQLEDEFSKYQEWVNTFKLDGNEIIVTSSDIFSAITIRKKSRAKFTKNNIVVYFSTISQVEMKTQETTVLHELELCMYNWNKILAHYKSGNGTNVIISEISQNINQFANYCFEFIIEEL